jgi:23S rRNA pseudouridine2604 synthase
MIQNKKTPYKKTSTRGATGASKRRAKNLRPTSTGRTTMHTNARPPVARVAKPRVANSYPMRLNKYLAQMSIASRREADALIEKGSIFVNGKKATLGTKVNKTDTVTLGGDKISAGNVKKEANRYFAYFKPVGVTTTKEVDAKDILSLTKFPVPVFPVGRLDKDSEGLIIMTNDGRVTERLLHPRSFHEKEYRVELNRPINNTLLRGIKSGLHVGGFRARPAQVRKADSPETMDIILTEGQNRQVRRMVKAFGFNVVNLLRFRIENIVIDGLDPGEQREIKGPELEEFLKRLKL